MNELTNSIIVDFPLRGEWWACNTPANVIPSHGTDMLGQRYAYDFVMVDWVRKGRPFYHGSSLQYYTLGVTLKECYGWGREVYAHCDGRVITVKDVIIERNRVHLVRDLSIALKNAFLFNPAKHDIQTVVGNYVIIMCGEQIYALFAHLQTDSIEVVEGQYVKKGDILGRVGHSGNSTAPHLHFQLMDSADMSIAKGIPCAFSNYEIFDNGKWLSVKDGVPSNKDRLRLE
ncbi:M23 family metallopeptidase [Proteinivorax tanatarense]|uniref:M23 family metallopeptidase n=1 Tax=Proteinivorax tanatarense TaxID=1260629 RepID=A0AAU7VK70_9FIRM